MFKNTINSENEIDTSKRWRTSTFVIFIFFCIMQIASLFVDANIMVTVCYFPISLIGSFINSLIFEGRNNLCPENDRRWFVFPNVPRMMNSLPYLSYNMFVFCLAYFIPLPILFFLPYLNQLEESDKCFYRFYNVFMVIGLIFGIIGVIYFIVAWWLLGNPYDISWTRIDSLIDRYNLYQFLPAEPIKYS